MLTHYDKQRELIESVLRLLDDIELHDDAFGLKAFRRELADSGRRFSDADHRYLEEFLEHVVNFESWKAKCDKADDDEVDDAVWDEMDSERNWLLDQREVLKQRFGRLLQ
jgi:hypothetical protein